MICRNFEEDESEDEPVETGRGTWSPRSFMKHLGAIISNIVNVGSFVT